MTTRNPVGQAFQPDPEEVVRLESLTYAGGAAWRWIHVGVAALAMVATLPGRTHGLGLFTEPILRSLHLDRESYGFLNLWATLLGGLFCLPCGWLIDRLGTRAVLTGTMAALGIVVIAMSGVQGVWVCAALILLTRGLGQSALSVASLSLIGRSAGGRTGLAMGVYACLTSLGFTLAFGVLRNVIGSHPDDWRPVWAGIGVAVLVAGLLACLLVRSRLLDADAGDGKSANGADGRAELSLTLGRALRSPAFWTFSVAVSFFGMVSSGTALFNESILAERGFSKIVFLNVALLGIPVGLASNLLGGWLATRWPLPRLLAAAMGGLALALVAFPHVATEAEVYLYAAGLAVSGGLITVCFFTVWRRGFGPAHLGQVQGAAQLLTVLFSALGPQLFASAQVRLGSYLPLFPYLAAASFGLAVAAWLARLPNECRRPASGGTDTSPKRQRGGEVVPSLALRACVAPLILTDEQRHFYHEHGFLVLRDFFTPEVMAEASAEADALLQRRDLIAVENLRCRWQPNVTTGACEFETFDPVIDLAPVCRRLALDARLLAVLACLYGEEACLFKDKLIFKPPGVKGYGLHQDYIAWPSFPRSFLTVLIPFDRADAANGCTEVFPGYHRNGSLSAEDGQYHELSLAQIDESRGVHLELGPGDLAIFSGFTPHRSAPNRSGRWRRQLYVSYNKLSDGGHQRGRHYEEFHRWLRARHARNGKTNLYFQ